MFIWKTKVRNDAKIFKTTVNSQDFRLLMPSLDVKKRGERKKGSIQGRTRLVLFGMNPEQTRKGFKEGEYLH